MLIGVILVSTIVLLGSVLLYTRATPFDRPVRCPNCRIPYLALVDSTPRGAPVRSYRVLACPQCTNTITRVHGTASRFAYCPACSQRTLETPAKRLSPTISAPLAVEVEERCHVCGHTDVVVLPNVIQADLGGKVIPFPGSRQ